MKVKIIEPLSANLNRSLIPLSEHKGPKLDLMFYEKDKIKLLQQELLSLEDEARDIITMVDVNKHLTGHQKTMCRQKLFHIDRAIETIKNNIYNIKKNRYAIQVEEYKNSIK